MKYAVIVLTLFLFSCASINREQEKREILLVDNVAVVNAKIDRVYAHLRLIELRQYEAIKTDKKLVFNGIITSEQVK
jgi:hypothetical protein